MSTEVKTFNVQTNLTSKTVLTNYQSNRGVYYSPPDSYDGFSYVYAKPRRVCINGKTDIGNAKSISLVLDLPQYDFSDLNLNYTGLVLHMTGVSGEPLEVSTSYNNTFVFMHIIPYMNDQSFFSTGNITTGFLEIL